MGLGDHDAHYGSLFTGFGDQEDHYAPLFTGFGDREIEGFDAEGARIEGFYTEGAPNRRNLHSGRVQNRSLLNREGP